MITTHCSAEMWRNMDHLSGYSPIFIPRKSNCQPLKDTGIKFCYRFYGKHFFFQSQLLKKRVKMSSISRLKIKLLLHIVYGDTCTTFLWYDGRKIYAHVQVCTGMIVYFHVQLVHACTCILMVQWYWFLQCNNYLLAKKSCLILGFVQYARGTLPRRTFTVMCVTVAQQK